jgi:two-component system response regulator GlrR
VPGLVEVADRGTLFLDEVDSLSPRAQVSLLRFLQDQRYRPLGGRVDRQSDVRIIAASNKRLEDLVDAGAFRADLLFRLKLMFLVMPPLRSRPGDARLLADYFVAGLNVRYGKTQKKATPQLEVWLESQPWPGNVRELENVVHRQYILADRAEIAPPGPFPDAGRGQQGVDGSEINLVYRSAKAAALAEFDRTYLRTLLSHSGGNVTLAARVARKERRALGKLIRKYGLRPDRFRVAEATGS